MSESWGTPGPYNTVVPDGKTLMHMRCIAGGGGGENGPGGGGGGAGGGGGSWVQKNNVSVMGGVPVAIVVGAGGIVGDHGQTSSVSLPNSVGVICSAVGGDTGQSQNGGSGGDAASGLGDVKHSGGKGADGNTYEGGAGGGGGRAVVDGSAGSGTVGGNYGGGRGATSTVGSSAGLACNSTAAGGGGGGGLMPSMPASPGGNGGVEIWFT